MRIFGVLSSYSFVNEMSIFAKHNVKSYLTKVSQESFMKYLLPRLREDSLLDEAAGDRCPVIDENLNLDSVVKYVRWKFDHLKTLHQFNPINLLRNWVVNEGYKDGSFKSHIFLDAAKAVHDWRFGEFFIKNYTLANVDKEGQHNFIASSSSGDLAACFNNYMHVNQDGATTDPKTYQLIAALIRDTPDNILFITDSLKEAKAAHDAKMLVIVIKRPREKDSELDPVTGNNNGSFREVTVSSFHEIGFINDPKRPPPCC